MKPRPLLPSLTPLPGKVGEYAGAVARRYPWVLQGQGWWRRPGRFFCKPVATRTAVADIAVGSQFKSHHVQPILITGATGTLGSAFARI